MFLAEIRRRCKTVDKKKADEFCVRMCFNSSKVSLMLPLLCLKSQHLFILLHLFCA